ncbi:phosphotransferase family protein [Brachybacterium alimentarium]|uniref:phosphotransferase family protein n=1 Tax=Brachybacterium alimentarium TaxID=47845 RepID=UPI003FD23F0A
MTLRLTWSDFPDRLRARLEEVLGGPVVGTHSCRGGFSSSSAEILRSPAGRRLFVKAVREQDNPGSMRLNRAEATVLEQMPDAAPVPALVAVIEQDEWFVLVTEAAPGELPAEPWDPAQLDQVLAAFDALQDATTPCPVPGLPSVAESLGPDMLGFDRVAEDPPTGLDPWLAARLDELRAAARRGIHALDGDTLCHSDVRADNLLIVDGGGHIDGGEVSIVDWAWASRGSRVADALQLLSSVEDVGGTLAVNARADAVLDSHGLPRQVGSDVFAGILGFFVDASRWPRDPSLPLLQQHRIQRRDSLLSVVRERWG